MGLNLHVNVDVRCDIQVDDVWCGSRLSCGYLCPRRFGIGFGILGIQAS